MNEDEIRKLLESMNLPPRMRERITEGVVSTDKWAEEILKYARDIMGVPPERLVLTLTKAMTQALVDSPEFLIDAMGLAATLETLVKKASQK